jgi:hypothetical protein
VLDPATISTRVVAVPEWPKLEDLPASTKAVASAALFTARIGATVAQRRATDVAGTLERIQTSMALVQRQAQVVSRQGSDGASAIPQLRKQGTQLRRAMKLLDQGKVTEAGKLVDQVSASRLDIDPSEPSLLRPASPDALTPGQVASAPAPASSADSGQASSAARLLSLDIHADQDALSTEATDLTDQKYYKV